MINFAVADRYAEARSGFERRDADIIESVGEKFDLTRERVRQIKEKAIRRLRHSSRSKLLKSYLG